MFAQKTKPFRWPLRTVAAFPVAVLALTAAFSVGCKKQREPEPSLGASMAVSAGGASGVADSGASNANAPDAATAASDAVQHAKPEVEPAPPAPPKQESILGDTIEASLYSFKTKSLVRCPKPAGAPVQASKDANSLRLGITVAITAKVDPFLSSPQHLTLDHDGVLLEAELKPTPACGSALPTKQMRAGETAQGVVVFTLPDLSFAKGLKLRYQPTRWGGAPPVSVDIPPCLDECPAKKAGQASH